LHPPFLLSLFRLVLAFSPSDVLPLRNASVSVRAYSIAVFCPCSFLLFISRIAFSFSIQDVIRMQFLLPLPSYQWTANSSASKHPPPPLVSPPPPPPLSPNGNLLNFHTLWIFVTLNVGRRKVLFFLYGFRGPSVLTAARPPFFPPPPFCNPPPGLK